MHFYSNMAINFIRVHSTTKGFISDGEQEFLKRINRFTSLNIIDIKPNKKWNSLQPNDLKQKEGEQILQQIQPNDTVILLDERGKQYSSIDFARFIEQNLAFGGGNLCFVVGGAFGFSQEVYARANSKLSLSKMTTSHQLVRVIFLEQLYRAFTILNNHPYHNE